MSSVCWWVFRSVCDVRAVTVRAVTDEDVAREIIEGDGDRKVGGGDVVSLVG